MKTYTVKQLADLSGVSVRTLHHYDEIGLLRPAFIKTNGYRHYGKAELDRLQQILLHRALDLSLEDIGRLLDNPGFDRLETLCRQRIKLAEKTARYAQILETIDRTIADAQGEHAMHDADLYGGLVSPEKQAAYEHWLVERYGEAVEPHLQAGQRKMAQMSQVERDAHMTQLADLEQGLAEAMRRGLPAESAALDPLLHRHRQWVGAAWAALPTPAQYAGLADTYLDHPDFRIRFEAIAPDFTLFLAAAMKAWAKRQDTECPRF